MRYQDGNLIITWYYDELLTQCFRHTNDVCRFCVDAYAGLVYGDSLPIPDLSLDQIDQWLIEQSERDDVVVVSGNVIPIIGQVTPQPDLPHRYYRMIYGSQDIAVRWRDTIHRFSVYSDIYLGNETVGRVSFETEAAPESKILQRILYYAVESKLAELRKIRQQFVELKSHVAGDPYAKPLDQIDIPF